MKFTFFTFLLSCFVYTTAMTQKLSLATLMDLASKSSWTDVNYYLKNQGWEFHESTPSNYNKESRVQWTYDLDLYSELAGGWFYIYLYNDKISKLFYRISTQEIYLSLQNSLSANGFKLVNKKTYTNDLIKYYENSRFFLTIEIEPNTSKRSQNSFNFTFIPKNSYYDKENGKKTVQFYGGGKSEYTLKNGEKHGEEIEYYNSGNIKKIVNYQNGKIHGVYKEYNANGTLALTGAFLNDKPNGHFVEYENGVKISEYEKKDGKTNGKVTTYYTNGKISSTSFIIDDKKNGIAKIYDDKGVLEEELNFKNDFKNGPSKVFYPSGKVKLTGTYIDNKMSGLITQYYESGKIQGEAYYLNDNLNGTFKIYDESGKLFKSKNYLNDEEDGIQIEYNEEGKEMLKYSAKNGKLNGEYIKYDALGRLQESSNYYNGDSHGNVLAYIYAEEEYNEDGEIVKSADLKIQGVYSYGQKHGKWIYHTILNNKESIFEYYNYSYGKKNGQCMEVQNDSLIFANYKEDILDGKYLLYRNIIPLFKDPNITDGLYFLIQGTNIDTDTTKIVLQVEGNYTNGKKSGFWKKYSEFGALETQGYYNNNLKNGEWKYYFDNRIYVEPSTNHNSYIGTLYLIENYNNGQLNGIVSKYYDIQQIKFSCDHNKKETCHRNEFTKLNTTLNYQNGVLHGTYTKLDTIQLSNGNYTIIEKGDYNNGKKTSKWTERYWVDSKKDYIWASGNYLDDKRDGQWIEFDTKGNTYLMYNYKNGLLHGEMIIGNTTNFTSKKEYNNGQFIKLKLFNADKSIDRNHEFYNMSTTNYYCTYEEYKSLYYELTNYNVYSKLVESTFTKDFNAATKVKDGKYRKYYLKDSIDIQGQYSNNIKEGRWVEVYPKQNILINLEYKAASLQREFYSKLDDKQPFSGKFIFLNPETNLIEERKIKKGLRNGSTEFIDPKTNKTISKEKYDEGIKKVKK